MGSRLPPPPPPFRIERDAEQTNWLDERLDPHFESPTELKGRVASFRAYIVIRGPLDALSRSDLSHSFDGGIDPIKGRPR